MERLPFLIQKDIIIYTLPLFLMNISRSEFNNKDYWMTIPGCVLAWAPMKSKTRLIISSILYLAQVFVPSFYFLVLGFILHQAYNSNILISKNQQVCNFITKIEIVGFLCSDIITIPAILKLILASLVIFISVTCNQPSVECSDPFESMKIKIDSPNLLNIEYRQFLSNEKTEGYLKDAKLFLTEILFMISDWKILLLFSSFFSFKKSELVIFLIGILYIFKYRWEYLCIVLKTEATSNVICRTCGTYIVYSIVTILNEIITNPAS